MKAPDWINRLAVVASTATLAFADHVTEARLTPSPPSPATQANATPVDVRNGTMVCGYPNDGRVVVFERNPVNGHSWTQSAVIIAPATATSSTLFGVSVALDGSAGNYTLVVGCTYYQATGTTPQSGAALVYVGSGSTWSLQQVVQSSAPVTNDWFGSSVALQGDRLVVGAARRDIGATLDVGSVSFFQRTGTTWASLGEFFDPSPVASANLGASVTLDGLTAVAGEPTGGANPLNGAVAVFDFQAGAWAHTVTLNSPYPLVQPPNLFGTSVALVGDGLVVGAPGCDHDCVHGTNVNHGVVGLYSRVGAIWSLTNTIAPPLPQVCGLTQIYGQSVDFDGTHVLIGAPSSTHFVNAGGVVSLYDPYSIPPTLIERPIPSSPIGGDDFGRSVALDSDGTIVAAARLLTIGSNKGYVYVFTPEQANIDRLCFGDGSANGGPDCPCSNNTAENLKQGCRNSTGRGGFAVALGSASAATNDLVVRAWNLPASVLCYLFAGNSPIAGGFGAPFGAGLRCASGPQRLGAQAASLDGMATWGPGLIGQGGWSAGDQRWLQVYYRDPTGCPASPALTFNLSNAVEVTVW